MANMADDKVVTTESKDGNSSDPSVKAGSSGRSIVSDSSASSEDGERELTSFPTSIIGAIQGYARLALNQAEQLTELIKFMRNRHLSEKDFKGTSDHQTVKEAVRSKFSNQFYNMSTSFILLYFSFRYSYRSSSRGR